MKKYLLDVVCAVFFALTIWLCLTYHINSDLVFGAAFVLGLGMAIGSATATHPLPRRLSARLLGMSLGAILILHFLMWYEHHVKLVIH
jgi:predicted neutral ceramidase superfamily lipid hydrolase